MNVLAIDIGGTNIKLLASGQNEARRFPSGREMTPQKLIDGVREFAGDWTFDVATIGYPGVVQHNRIVTEPHNLAPGWVGFDFEQALGCPVRIINDAAMQALGSYDGGELLFLGLGTGLGSAMVVDGIVVPMELAHLPYRKGRTFEDYLGVRGLDRLGKKKWQKHVETAVAMLVAALRPSDVVLGGGNIKKLTILPTGCRAGSNSLAFVGGFRLWDSPADRHHRRSDVIE